MNKNTGIDLLAVYRKKPKLKCRKQYFFIKLIHNMVNNTSDNVIILGDFIYKTIYWDNLQTIYSDISDVNNKEEKNLNCVLDNYLIQHVKVNTRFRQGQQYSKLDLVFTKRR